MTSSYEQIYRDFRWRIPELYNIGVNVCDRQVMAGRRTAILFVNEEENTIHEISFHEICRMANRFANCLAADGLTPGDRVAVLLPESIEAAVAYIATFKAGLIAVPLPSPLTEEGLLYRLSKSGSKVLVTDSVGGVKASSIRKELPHLCQVYVSGHCSMPGYTELEGALRRSSPDFLGTATRASDPAILAFTSGTEGAPKGVLHAHRSLLGALPVLELIHDDLPKAGELFWTSADWGWLAGLFPVLGAWHYGMAALVCRPAKFDPQQAMARMAKHGVKSASIPPTALKLMRLASSTPQPIRLRSLLSGGERLGDELLDWAEATFGVPVQEVYGQTECNGVIASNIRLFALRPGSMGKTIPGHDVRILNPEGTESACGEPGVIAVRQPDPGTFLGYWDDPLATARKVTKDFLLTGDIASQDEEGYFWYLGREDDTITSSGYRIDPLEVERALGQYPAIFAVAVAGVPDRVCTESVKAWVVLKPGYSKSEQLGRAIQQFAKEHLASHMYPRHISFVDSLPLTPTGKVMRRELRSQG